MPGGWIPVKGVLLLTSPPSARLEPEYFSVNGYSRLCMFVSVRISSTRAVCRTMVKQGCSFAVSPMTAQRLLLESFHLELARSFGSRGICITGAGSGWTEMMCFKNRMEQIFFPTTNRSDPNYVQRERALGRECTDTSSPRFEECSKKFGTVDYSAVSPTTMTAFDKYLLKTYDMTGSRANLYVPMVTIFKSPKPDKKKKIHRK